MNQNRLSSENCNKAQCKSCIFGPTPLELSPKRKAEIEQYLATFQASHICHTTNRTCHGALQFQAKILYAMGIIKQPTVENLLEVALTYLTQGQMPMLEGKVSTDSRAQPMRMKERKPATRPKKRKRSSK